MSIRVVSCDLAKASLVTCLLLAINGCGDDGEIVEDELILATLQCGAPVSSAGGGGSSPPDDMTSNGGFLRGVSSLNPTEETQGSIMAGLPFVLDANLAMCISNNMKANGWQDFSQVESLVCRNEGVLDLSDIAQLNMLEELDLSNDDTEGGLLNQITDFSPLSALTDLQVLVLDQATEVVNFSEILAIPNLEYLSVVDGELVEIPQGKQFVKMRELYLRRTKGVEAISFSMFPDLRALDVGENDIGQLVVDNNPRLKVLLADRNQLAGLNLGNNPLLKVVDVTHNFLPDADGRYNRQLATVTNVSNNSGMPGVTGFAAPALLAPQEDYTLVDNNGRTGTTGVAVQLTLAASAPVLVELGTTISTLGPVIGVAQGGAPVETASTLNTSGRPTPFDFSLETNSLITAIAEIAPFDFSVNTSTTLTAAQAIVGSDFSGTNNSSFDLTIADGSGDGGDSIATITLDQNFVDVNLDILLGVLNTTLNGIADPGVDVRAREDPDNAGLLQFYATVTGDRSTVTVDNFVASGAATTADIVSLLGGLIDGASAFNGSSTFVSFEVRLAGGADVDGNQTRTITLDSNIQTFEDLIADIGDDLTGTGIGLDVREDPTQPGGGILQFFATVFGEGSTIQIDPNDALTTGTDVLQIDVHHVLGRIRMGADNNIEDPDYTGSVGSLSEAFFDITLAGAAVNNGGPITITLDSNVQTLADLINDIQDELNIANMGVDVREDPDNAGWLQFFATVTGEPSIITVDNLNSANQGVTIDNLTDVLNISTGVTVLGIIGADNAYPAQTVDVINTLDNRITSVTTLAAESAADIAVRFDNVTGVSASASTIATLTSADYINSGSMQVSINDVVFSSTSLANLAIAVTNSSSLPGVSAVIDENGDLLVSDEFGHDLMFLIASTDVLDTLGILGPNGLVRALDLAGGNTAAAVGGAVSLMLDAGVLLANAAPDLTGLFDDLVVGVTEFVVNDFDPANPDTYNFVASFPVYDSLVLEHELSLFFVKDFDGPDLLAPQPNRWTLFVQIDGEDVGDPDPTMVDPDVDDADEADDPTVDDADDPTVDDPIVDDPTLDEADDPAVEDPGPVETPAAVATRASFLLKFNEIGQLIEEESDAVHITNWTPINIYGNPNGALGPVNADEAVLPVPDPQVSSNFVIDLTGSTMLSGVYVFEFAIVNDELVLNDNVEIICE